MTQRLKDLVYADDPAGLSAALEAMNNYHPGVLGYDDEVDFPDDELILIHPIRNNNTRVLKVLINNAKINVFALDSLAHRVAKAINPSSINILELYHHPAAYYIDVEYFGTVIRVKCAPNTTPQTLKFLIEREIDESHRGKIKVSHNSRLISLKDVIKKNLMEITLVLPSGKVHYPLLGGEDEHDLYLSNLFPATICSRMIMDVTNKASLINKILDNRKLILTEFDEDAFIEVLTVFVKGELDIVPSAFNQLLLSDKVNADAMHTLTRTAIEFSNDMALKLLTASNKLVGMGRTNLLLPAIEEDNALAVSLLSDKGYDMEEAKRHGRVMGNFLLG